MAVRKRLSRRTFLTSTVSAAALSAMSREMSAADANARPNILWLVSEDNFPFIGAYGDARARTPAIDALAKAGVRYVNAFSNAPVCAPSRFAIITGMHAESCGPAHHMRAQGKVPSFVHGFPKYLRDAGYYCTNNGKTDYNAELDMAAMWDDASERAHWRNRPERAPFFAVFNLMTTHESQMFASVDGQVKPMDVRVPAYLPDVPATRRDIASYYNLMERMDAEVAAHLAALDDADVADDTIVFYYSDNGGVLPRSKRYCYDQGLRVAMIARFPARWAHLAPVAAGATITSPITLLDLAPTVLTIAGIEQPAHMRGASLLRADARRSRYSFGMRNRMDERYDMVRTVRDERYRYIRNYMPHRPQGQHMAFEWQMDSYRALETEHIAGRLTAIQARFFQEKPAEEFYDLVADPDQIVNHIGAREHQERIFAMRAALDDHMIAINDNGFIPEGSALEGFAASRAQGAYPLRRVLRLAGEVIQRDPRQVARFRDLLEDPNEVIRYWAAQGLLMLGERASAATPELEKCLEQEPSSQVRIVVAEALARLGVTERPIRSLGEALGNHPDARVRLQALNALTFVGEPARALLPLIEDSIRSAADEYIRNAARYLSFVLRGTYTPSSPVYQGRGARTA